MFSGEVPARPGCELQDPMSRKLGETLGSLGSLGSLTNASWEEYVPGLVAQEQERQKTRKSDGSYREFVPRAPGPRTGCQ